MSSDSEMGRNSPCPCGSGKKYKKCCLSKDEEAEIKLRGADTVNTPPRNDQKGKLKASGNEFSPRKAGSVSQWGGKAARKISRGGARPRKKK